MHRSPSDQANLLCPNRRSSAFICGSNAASFSGPLLAQSVVQGWRVRLPLPSSVCGKKLIHFQRSADSFAALVPPLPRLAIASATTDELFGLIRRWHVEC